LTVNSRTGAAGKCAHRIFKEYLPAHHRVGSDPLLPEEAVSGLPRQAAAVGVGQGLHLAGVAPGQEVVEGAGRKYFFIKTKTWKIPGLFA